MTTPTLQELPFLPYLEQTGNINPELEGKMGIYAIFDQGKTLQYIGYSRNLYLSLKQHLVRQTDACVWLKIHRCDRPQRSLLEAIKQNWLEENQTIPLGNSDHENLWTQPINAKLTMSETEKEEYQQQDDIGKIQLLKQIARRLEESIKVKLQEKGVTMEIRFNPKLKEQGLLDLK